MDLAPLQPVKLSRRLNRVVCGGLSVLFHHCWDAKSSLRVRYTNSILRTTLILQKGVESDIFDKHLVEQPAERIVSRPVILDFEVPMIQTPESAAKCITDWISDKETHPSFSMAGMLTSDAFGQMIAGSLDKSVVSNFRLLMTTSTIIYNMAIRLRISATIHPMTSESSEPHQANIYFGHLRLSYGLKL